MAKNSHVQKSPSRIRFIMVEAELGDGDIGQITQAITNALRPPAATGPIKRIAPASHLVSSPHVEDENSQEQEAIEPQIEEMDASAKSATPKVRTPRKVGPKPNVIDIDLDSEPPLSTLQKQKSIHRRYLTVARWLHDHRATPVVGVDHVYTCFRHLGWPINIPDFAQPFRELKHKQYFTQPDTGKYAINQLGLAKAAEIAD